MKAISVCLMLNFLTSPWCGAGVEDPPPPPLPITPELSYRDYNLGFFLDQGIEEKIGSVSGFNKLVFIELIIPIQTEAAKYVFLKGNITCFVNGELSGHWYGQLLFRLPLTDSDWSNSDLYSIDANVDAKFISKFSEAEMDGLYSDGKELE